MDFKSKYFQIKHQEFTKEDIKAALKDLERFKKNFERARERERIKN